MEAAATSEGGAARPTGMIPDILLDGDRLNMLLDIVCADYITASYASRENGKRVVLKALEKLYISVHAATGDGAAASAAVRPAQDAAFQERARRFYDDMMAEFRARRRGQRPNPNADAPTPPGSTRVLDDSVVREVMKPRLLQIVEELCRDRDRQLVLSASGAPAGPGALHSNAIGATSTAPSTSDALEGEADAAVPPTTGEIRMEGWLRKKGQHVNLWRDRYFMIRSTPNGTHFLCYFRRKGDKEPRGWYVLGPGTTVDEVRESPSKIETKKLFTFRIRHLAHASTEDVEDASGGVNAAVDATPGPMTTRNGEFPLSPPDSTTAHDSEFDAKPSVKRSASRKFRSRAAAAAAAATAATAVVLTGGLAGVGMGVMGMSMSAAAAASAGAAGAMIAQSRNKGPIALAAESLETAVWWRNSILECIAQAEEQWKRYLNWYMDHDRELNELEAEDQVQEHRERGSSSSSENGSRRRANSQPPAKRPSWTAPVPPSSVGLADGGRRRSGSFGSMPRSIAKSFRTSATFSQETSWRLYEFSSKLRVDTECTGQQNTLRGSAPPALRTSLKVKASPRRVFEMLMQMDSPFYASNHVIQQAQVIEENSEDHSDVVYWKLFPTYLWPVHVGARDLCLLRYWRKEPDGSYFVCFQSTTHTGCPWSGGGTVRANIMGGGFIISPRVQEDSDNCFDECWVTLTIQMSPNGWLDSKLARSWYYVHAYGVFFLEMITALTAQGGQQTARPVIAAANRRQGGARAPFPSQQIVSEVQFPMLERYQTELTVQHALPTKFWSEPSATGFMVRGPQYLSSKTKVPSAHQACRLVNVELYKSSEPIQHIGVSSFVGEDFEPTPSNDHPFVFIINFMLPGPPHHSLILYFTPEHPEELKKNSVFADLCHELLRGPSNEFRTQRLKLIPRVVQGTWPIREGVGTTPAILGTKIYQTYHQGKQYLEVDYDIGSSTVATGILNLLLGFSRDLIIDLAFVIEAQSVMELPERVLGTVRLDCIDLRHAEPYTKRQGGEQSRRAT